jgi:type IV pilus assembly protein PilC
MREALDGISETISAGGTFSEALTAYPKIFDNLYVNMVNAGEAGGVLEVVLGRLAEFAEKADKIKNKVKGAMIYPIVLLVLTVAVVLVIFVGIMPVFEPLFEGTEVNVIARFLMAGSDFIVKRWPLLIIGAVLIIAGIIYALKVPSIRYKIDTYKITMPKVGPLMVKIYTARFSRTLSSLYSSGIPMVECLERSSAILGNSYIDQCFENVIDEVKQGETLSSAIQRTEIFDSMFCSIIYVGEESGALDDILEKTSDYYEEESESAIQRLVGMLEPVLIIVLGVVIGLVVAGVYPALYGSFDSMENE